MLAQAELSGGLPVGWVEGKELDLTLGFLDGILEGTELDSLLGATEGSLEEGSLEGLALELLPLSVGAAEPDTVGGLVLRAPEGAEFGPLLGRVEGK